MPKLANNARALLIGVDDYRTYDPEGWYDLRGSVNDVQVWLDVCRSLGIEPQHTRVLVSPANGAALPHLDGVRVEEATRENILKGVAWLAQAVGHGEGRTGLLTFSGHGDVADHDLALCPSDVAPSRDGAPSQLIDFATLKQILGDAEDLTIVLDCCFAGTPEHHRSVLSLARGPVPSSIARSLSGERSPLGGRLLTASKVEQLAHQAVFGGRYHGAFTWALTSALLQWRRIPHGHTVRLGVSYATLRDTAEKLLAALSHEQQPALVSADAASLSFMQSGITVEARKIMPSPYEIDPGNDNYSVWTITMPAVSDTPGWILSTNTGYSTPIQGGTYTIDAPNEVWDMPASLLSDLQNNTSGTYAVFTHKADLNWPTTPGTTINHFPPSATVADMAEDVRSLTWTACNTPSNVYGNNSVAFGFSHMSINGNGVPSGSVDWYYMGAAPPTSPLLTGTETFYWNRVGTPGQGMSWYHASAPITAVAMTR
jgi:hypothetical protein